MKHKTINFTTLTALLFGGMLTIFALTGCSESSRKEVRSLSSLIEQFQAADDQRSQQLSSGDAQLGYPFILEGYENQLSLIKEHRSENQYEGKIKIHLDTMEKSLLEGINQYKSWIDSGYDGAQKPAPDEVTAVNKFAIALTEAETALTIIAGK